MDNWLIFQYPDVNEGVTEKARKTGEWIPEQAHSVAAGKPTAY